MKLDIMLEEFDRTNMIQEDKELCEFYHAKLEEFDISTPDDLEDVNGFFQELYEEWVEELDVDDMISIYDDVCETYDDPKKINLHFLHLYITEKFKKVVRQGKIVKKKVCRPGFSLKDGKCVKTKAAEKRKRAKGAKRGAKKKKGQKSAIARKAKKSMKKRKNF